MAVWAIFGRIPLREGAWGGQEGQKGSQKGVPKWTQKWSFWAIFGPFWTHFGTPFEPPGQIWAVYVGLIETYGIPVPRG